MKNPDSIADQNHDYIFTQLKEWRAKAWRFGGEKEYWKMRCKHAGFKADNPIDFITEIENERR